MSDYVIIQKDTLTAMGDAVREATGETKLYTLDEIYKKLGSEFINKLTEEYALLTYLPEGITKIRDYAFYRCSKLVLTCLPEGLISIGNYAFNYCTGLTNITFKGTPQTIGIYAFNGCTNLTTINVPWSEGAVANAPWGATNAVINYNYTEEGGV